MEVFFNTEVRRIKKEEYWDCSECVFWGMLSTEDPYPDCDCVTMCDNEYFEEI